MNCVRKGHLVLMLVLTQSFITNAQTRLYIPPGDSQTLRGKVGSPSVLAYFYDRSDTFTSDVSVYHDKFMGNYFKVYAYFTISVAETATYGAEYPGTVTYEFSNLAGEVRKTSNFNYIVVASEEPSNETVSPPTTPAGLARGLVGQTLTFTAGGAASSDGHALEYQFDWGDGHLSSWGSVTQSHIYLDSGTFSVLSRARCTAHNDIVSDWSNAKSVSIEFSSLSITVRPSGAGSVDRDTNTSTFAYGDSVQLTASANPGYRFDRWSGDVTGSTDTQGLNVTGAMNVTAHFVREDVAVYVHANASGPQEGSFNCPFASIQQAIDKAEHNGTVVILPGVYHECVDLMGKNLTLTGVDPNPSHPGGFGFPVIDAQGQGPVFKNPGRSEFMGLVLTGGRSGTGAVLSSMDTCSIFSHCVIVGNTATDQTGAVVDCENSMVTFENCTLADNVGGPMGAGLASRNSDLTISHSIVWDNAPRQIHATAGVEPKVRYSNIAGGCLGEGNMNRDPYFVSSGRGLYTMDTTTLGDYHLMSTAGRWNSHTQSWQEDVVMSPCIDAGWPGVTIGQEAYPHGFRINIGAYGGTDQASLSVE